ncbi:MAG: hypothetical protein HZB51_34105 [Chloroflexi bacterium]|nr:hypothetical protein [Chloroflexota bacterium]
MWYIIRTFLEFVGLWTLAILALAFDWLPRRIEQETGRRVFTIAALLGLIGRRVFTIAALLGFITCGASFALTVHFMHSTRTPNAQNVELDDRPIPKMYRVYLPLVYKDWIGTQPSPKKGVSSPWTENDAKTLRATWAYNWSPNTNYAWENFEGVPMIWGIGDIDKPLLGNSQYALLFNEPDLVGQANISPSAAVSLTRKIFLAHPDRKWISPAPSQINPAWLMEWRAQYVEAYGEEPPITGIALHCYAFVASDCIAYVRSMVTLAEEWNLDEVWVTEFAFPTGLDRTLADATHELEMFLDYLDDEPRVARYAAYTTRLAGDEFEWGSPDYANIAPLLTYRRGARTPFGRVYAQH